MKAKYLKLLIPVVVTGILGILATFTSGGTVYSWESSPTPTPSPTPSAMPTPSSTPQPSLGSIRVCKIIIDANRNIVDGLQTPGVSFTIKGLPQAFNSGKGPGGVLPNTTFTAPLSLSADLLGSDGKNDAFCVTYNNLAVGDYFYSQETISAQSGWGAPQYNDQFTSPIKTVGSFSPYGGSFNKDADGQILLEAKRPDRTLVVLNTMRAVATTTPTPSPTPSPTPGVGGAVNNNTNNNSQSQSQTQNNDQTVNVNVNQSVLGATTPAKQPETGLSVLGLASVFSAAPFGLMLSRFGRGRLVYKKKEQLGVFAVETFENRKQKSGIDQ